jgi:hypothetical protein
MKDKMLGVGDVDKKILLMLDDRSLFNACQTDSRYSKICQDETFWRTRYIEKFGIEAAKHKPKGTTWKKDYLQTVIDLENFPGIDALSDMIVWDTQKGLEGSYWAIRDNVGFPILQELKPFTDAPNKVMSWFWLKRLDEVKLWIKDGAKIFYDITPAEIYKELSKFPKDRYVKKITYYDAYNVFPIYASKEEFEGYI